MNFLESETEDSYESQKFKYGNKDRYASICQSFLEKSPNSANVENLYDDRQILKLKGGGRKERAESQEVHLKKSRNKFSFELVTIFCYVWINEYKTQKVCSKSILQFVSS